MQELCVMLVDTANLMHLRPKKFKMQRQSLIVYLAHQTLSSVSKKGLFSGQYVVFGEYLEQTKLLFEISSDLGHLYRDNLTTLDITFM